MRVRVGKDNDLDGLRILEVRIVVIRVIEYWLGDNRDAITQVGCDITVVRGAIVVIVVIVVVVGSGIVVVGYALLHDISIRRIGVDLTLGRDWLLVLLIHRGRFLGEQVVCGLAVGIISGVKTRSPGLEDRRNGPKGV